MRVVLRFAFGYYCFITLLGSPISRKLHFGTPFNNCSKLCVTAELNDEVYFKSSQGTGPEILSYYLKFKTRNYIFCKLHRRFNNFYNSRQIAFSFVK